LVLQLSGGMLHVLLRYARQGMVETAHKKAELGSEIGAVGQAARA
jgi:hypothetical protein